MSFSIYVNFNGTCKDAVTFYAEAFGLTVPEMMTFGQAPPDDNYAVADADKDKVMHTCLNIHGVDVMFSDVPSDMPFSEGNNISITISSKDMEEIKSLFNKMSVGGQVIMELQNTFWSDQYGMLTDKFGIIWQFSHDSGKC